MKNNPSVWLLAILAAACQPKTEKQTTEAAPVAVTLEQAWATDTLLRTPESVLFDTANNVAYVSCINGVPPDAQDEDGYIAKIALDGTIVDGQWITGIDAPKGMGLYNGTLYVTNIDELVLIDVAAGTISQRIPVEGAAFLNDVDVDGVGNVYFSDSGTNKIYMLSGDSVSVWAEGDALGGPNGLLHLGDKMMLATFGIGNFNEIDPATKVVKAVTDSIPGGDGIVKVGDDFLVSNWNGEIYHITADYKKTKVLDTKGSANAADIWYVESANLVLVPTFFGNQVVAYKVNR